MGEAATVDPEALAVTRFWRDAGMEKWFPKSDAFDAEFRQRFADLHWAAARREKDEWAETPEGTLALLILLDQFPRNCFRGTAHMFATDPLARHFARRALDAGHLQAVEPALQIFFLLPFEHSEDIADQYFSVEMAAAYGDEYIRYALEHRDIIQRFGRFPHRNPALGRDTTLEEQAYLDAGGFKG